MRTLKVFDRDDLGHTLCNIILRHRYFEHVANGSYVDWIVEYEKPQRILMETEEEYAEWCEEYDSDHETRAIDAFLITKGCETNESVILEHSW